MKKTLVAVAAAALLATGIAPAFAGDVELSGEVRVRHEYSTNMYDGDDTTGDQTNVTTQRTRVNFKGKVDDQTTAFVALHNNRMWGEDNNSTTPNNKDVGLNEGWIEIKNLAGPVSLKAGRQRLAYGDERIQGALEWSDQGRRYDAWKLSVNTEAVDVDLFFAETDDDYNSAITYANWSSPANKVDGNDNDRNGLYVTLKMIENNKIDLYYFQDTVTATGKDMSTIGARIAGKAADLDYSAEYAQQGGDNTATQDKDASLMAITAGYTLKDVLGGFRIGGEYFSVTGNDPATADDEAFDAGNSTGHFHYGIADAEGNSDVEGFALKLSAKPANGLTVKAEYWALEDEVTGNNEITEINLQAYYNLTEKVNLYVYGCQVDYKSSGWSAPDKGEKYGVQLHAKF